ncbi:MAG: hypothetical protein EBT83_03220 [Betaproteobacteria bacterium]|jgi:glucose-6-phosphate isomerase|nr:hypothetical protein [Betaproteobacteria bacterium]
MYQIVIMLKAVNEVALIALLGQGLLYVIAGSRREQNFVYSLFKIVTRPVLKFTRWIAPRFIVDQHIGLLAMFIVLVIEAALILAKIALYLEATAA